MAAQAGTTRAYDTSEDMYRKAPHDYQHVGGGRWMCPACREFIVNRDCRENTRWLLGQTPASRDSGASS
jgi:hypothetical protein